MSNEEIFSNPSYKMILEGPFDDLMEEIWGNEFVYIGSWKVVGEGLKFSKILGKRSRRNKSYYYI